MSDIFDTLVMDRPDINTYYNISDLNRVEEAVKQLAQRMTNEGYYVTPKPKTPTVIPEIIDPEAPGSGGGGGGGGGTTDDIDGYSPVEHIASNGTQYIDTGFNPSPNTTVEVVFQFTSLLAQQRIFSARGTFFYDVYISGYGNYSFGYQNGSGNWINTGVPVDTNKHTIVFDGYNKEFKLDGTVIASLEGYNATETSNETMELFRGTSGAADNYGKLKMYSCKVYEAGVLVRDFIPVVDADGVGLLYDKLNGVPYYNVGTGVFAYGEDKYTPVEYIESSGTQYINTGFKPTNNSKVEVTVSDWTSNEASTAVFGSYSSSSNRYELYITSSSYRYYYRSNYKAISGVSVSDKTLITCDRNVATIGDVSVTATATTFTMTYPLYLFATNSSGSLVRASSLKMYGAKLYENDTLLCDLIPVVDTYGVGLMYDKLNDVPYYNAGSGTFNAGAPVVKEPSEDEPEGDPDIPEIDTDPDIPEIDIDPYIWNVYDIPTDKETERYINNLLIIRRQFNRKEINIPETMNAFTYIGANNIELLLYVVDKLLKEMIQQYRNCNTFKCGERR